MRIIKVRVWDRANKEMIYPDGSVPTNLVVTESRWRVLWQ